MEVSKYVPRLRHRQQKKGREAWEKLFRYQVGPGFATPVPEEDPFSVIPMIERDVQMLALGSRALNLTRQNAIEAIESGSRYGLGWIYTDLGELAHSTHYL